MGFQELFRDLIIIPKKNYKTVLNVLFAPVQCDELTTKIEHVIVERAVALMYAQYTSEWFSLCAFHVTATMAAKNVNSTTTLDTITMYKMLI